MATSERTPRRILLWLEDAQLAVDEGRLDEAEQALANVRRKRPDLPELALVEGDLAAARGDVDGAVERYRDAAKRDPEWAAPRVEAAWAELDRDDAEAAIELAREIIDGWADDPAARAAAWFVTGVAHLTLEDTDEAKRCFDEVEKLEPEDPELLFELAHAWYDLGEPAREEKLYRALLAHDPNDSDALHALGGCLHERGAKEEATEAWLRVRELDLAEQRSDLELGESELESIAERTLRELPEAVRDRLVNVPIFVEEVPSEALVRDGVDPRLLGLFTGTPLPEKSHLEGSPSAPDAAVLYLRNLESACGDRDELVEQVRITILHETAHFFGLEDEDLEALGLG